MDESPSKLPVVNPSTGEIVVELYVASEAAIRVKYQQLQDSKWGQVPYMSRMAVIEKFQALLRMRENAELLATVMAEEMGKPVSQGRETVGACDYRIQWFLDTVPDLLLDETPNAKSAPGDLISYDPMGVVGFLPAFNFPVLMLVDFLAPALLMGNVVLMKPSE